MAKKDMKKKEDIEKDNYGFRATISFALFYLFISTMPNFNVFDYVIAGCLFLISGFSIAKYLGISK